MPSPRQPLLAPCPFCGGEAMWERFTLATGKGVTVTCQTCKAQVFVNNNAGGLDEAIRRWNRRVNTAAPSIYSCRFGPVQSRKMGYGKYCSFESICDSAKTCAAISGHSDDTPQTRAESGEQFSENQRIQNHGTAETAPNPDFFPKPAPPPLASQGEAQNQKEGMPNEHTTDS